MNRYPVAQHGPVEAWLRPPAELWAALLHGSAALICVLAPWALMMPSLVAWPTAGLFSLAALWRLRQGLFIRRYQRGLRELPDYRLRADRIPVSHTRLFLGRGFRWESQHTQRLLDTRRPGLREFLEPSRAHSWARAIEHGWERRTGLRWAARLAGTRAWWNPVAPLPPVGGNPVLHAVEPYEQDVTMDLGERVGHTLVVGTTRVGKTRLAEILIAQDIRRGDVVIVFDPKGDADLLRRVYAEAKRARRLDQLYVFHLGYPDLSCRYNAVGSFTRITEVASRIANQLSGEGNSAAFKEFGWRFTNVVARALAALGQRPTYELILRYVANIEPLFQDYCRAFFERRDLQGYMHKVTPGWSPVGWELEVQTIASGINERNKPMAMRSRENYSVALVQYLRQHRVFDPVLDGLRSAVEYDKTYFDKITASLLPMLEKLTTGRIAELLSPDYYDLTDPRPILDWEDVIRTGGIVYFGLDALTDQIVSTAVGASAFADLTALAGRLYKAGAAEGIPGEAPRRRISIHGDEFNELMGPEFIPLANKAGGAGVQLTVYTQTASDIEARIGSRPRAGQVLGNLNTLIMLRVKELATAELLTAQLPMCEITSLVPASGAHDTAADGGDAHFTSANQDLVTKSREPLLTPHELVTLPKGQAFCLLEGGQLWKVRLPLPDASADPAMPAGLAQIAADMARRYRTGEAWWQQEESTGIVPLPDAPAAGPDDQQSTPAGIPEQPASLASRGRAAASAEAALMDGANGARGV